MRYALIIVGLFYLFLAALPSHGIQGMGLYVLNTMLVVFGLAFLVGGVVFP